MSGSQILFRTVTDHRNRLNKAAVSHGLSLNELCLRRLSVPSGLETAAGHHHRQVLATADRLFGADLIGVVFYGSRARGSALDASDWDFLVVPAASVAVTRQIYHRWDEVAQDLPEQTEVHFAHLPASTRISTGFWSELALDGIVIYEQPFLLSRHLAKVRQEMLSGQIIQKKSHGQSYWIHTEAA